MSLSLLVGKLRSSFVNRIRFGTGFLSSAQTLRVVAGFGLLALGSPSIHAAAPGPRHTTVNSSMTVNGVSQPADEIFLGGNFLEIGVNPGGSFGTHNTSLPSGFFATAARTKIGMVTDLDGFGVGVAESFDYFMPGTPFVAFSAGYKIAGVTTTGTNTNLAAGVTVQMPTTITDTSSGTNLSVTASSTLGGKLKVDQVIGFAENDKFFRIAITLTNVGAEPLDSARYQWIVDPDNTKDLAGDYKTDNSVPYTHAAGDGKAVVMGSSIATDPVQASLVLYSTDPRAKGSYGNLTIYAAAAYDTAPAKGSTLSQDTRIAMTWDVGTLAVGASTSFQMYVAMSNADLSTIETEINNSVTNTAPSDLALSAATINQSAGTNGVVGTLSATDVDVVDTHTFSLVSGAGDTHNSQFNISSGSLRANDATALAAGTYSVRIRATDSGSGNLTYEEAFTITVVDNIAPTVTSVARHSPGSAAVNAGGSVIYRVSFDSSVSGISTADFVLTATGSATGTITGVSATSGSTVDVTVGSLQGAGSLRLDVNAGSVADSASNTLASSYTLGESYTVAKATATVILSNLSTTYSGSAQPVGVSTTPGSLTVNVTYAGSATAPTDAGSYAVNAVVNDSVYEGSASGTLVISKAAQTITFTPPSTAVVGAALVLSASSSSSLPVSFSLVSGNASLLGSTLTTTGAGSIVVRASQAGSTNFLAAADVDQTITVGKAAQTISFTAPTTATFGDTLSLSGSSTSGLPVSFSVVSGPASLSGSSLSLSGAGSVVIRAAQAGDSTYAAATSIDQTITVAKASQTVTFSSIPARTIGVPVALTASSSSGLPVTFSVVVGNATVSGSALTVNDTGAVTIRANQVGNSDYLPAFTERSISGTHQLTQTISFDAPATKLATDDPFVLSATASSGLPVSFAVVQGNGILGGNTLTLTAVPGSVTIRASQAGNSTYAAAAPVERTITILPVGPQVYFGNVGADSDTGRVAAVVAKDNYEGTLIGYLPGNKEGFVVPFAAVNGSFRQQVETFSGNNGGAGGASVSFKMPAAKAATDAISTVRIATSLAQPTRTFSGVFSNGVISGTIEELGLSFSATLLPQDGSTAALAGYYAAPSVETSTGGTHAVVGTRGELFVLAISRDLVDASAGQIASDGGFSVQTSSNTKVEGKVDVGSTTVTGAITAAGKAAEAFQGLSGTTQRTDRLMNLSARTRLQSGDTASILITGFVVEGPAPKQILLRGVGPALGQFGLANTLGNPQIRVFSGSQVVAENDDWSGSDVEQASNRVGAFALPSASRDAAMLVTLNPGAYTVHLAGGSGVGLLEMYDASENPQGEFQRLVNVSARGAVSAGDGVLIGGFIVRGNSPKRVLVRGVGPGLTTYGVPGVLNDPVLSVFTGQTVIARNDNWEAPQALSSTQTAAPAAEILSASAQVGGFPLSAGSKDAALIVVLAPGAYTAQVAGAGGATGVALIEVYEIPE